MQQHLYNEMFYFQSRNLVTFFCLFLGLVISRSEKNSLGLNDSGDKADENSIETGTFPH